MSAARLFEALIAADRAMSEDRHRAAKLYDLRDRTRKRCGNCDHWMKSSRCPLEHNVKGQHTGPGCDHYPCGKFQSSPRHLEYIAEYEAFAVITSAHGEQK